MSGRTESDLEKGVQMVLDAGLATGHADTWLQLLEEVLDQVEDLRLGGILSGQHDAAQQSISD